MLETPEPASVAVSATVTVEGYVLFVQLLPLHEMVVDGAVPSMRISCDLTASALPARSVEKYFTVRVWLMLKDAVYRVLDVVGVDPSVV